MQDFNFDKMRKTSKVIFVFVLVSFVFCGCNPQKKISGNYNYKTECLNVELDGSETMKAWGEGRNRWDAIEQARKNAVRDVLFYGVCNGKPDCNCKPILNEVNVKEKYEDYFNAFFVDDGPYQDYVKFKDERIGSKIRRSHRRARQQITQGVVVRVLRYELKKKMIEDGILKTN